MDVGIWYTYNSVCNKAAIRMNNKEELFVYNDVCIIFPFRLVKYKTQKVLSINNRFTMEHRRYSHLDGFDIKWRKIEKQTALLVSTKILTTF